MFIVFLIDFHDLNGRWMEHRARTGPCSMGGVTINADSVSRYVEIISMCIGIYAHVHV